MEFAKAEMIRPQIVGSALQEIAKDPDVLTHLFRILEYQRIIDNAPSDLVIVPEVSSSDLLTPLLASERTSDVIPGLSETASRYIKKKESKEKPEKK